MKFLALLLMLGVCEGAKWNRTMHISVQNQMTTYIHWILQQYIQQERNLMVSFTDDDNSPVDFLLERINRHDGAIRLSRLDTPEVDLSHHYEKTESYIIIANNKHAIRRQVQGLMDSNSWNNRARFLVIVTIPVENPQRVSLDTVKDFWHNANVLDVVVLVADNKVLKLYTWFPYNSEKECWVIKDVVLLSQWNMEGEGKLIAKEELFTNKIPKKFNGCPMTVSIPFKELSEVMHFLRYSLQVFNFTIHYRANHSDDANSYDRARNMIQDVVFGFSEIAYGIALQEDIVTFLEPSYPINDHRYMWYVPCAKPFDRIQRISGIFSISVWVVLSALLLLLFVVIRCLASRSTEGHAYINTSTVLYNVCAISMGVSVTQMPRTYRLRAVILAWACYCFAISTIFLTFFTSFLVDPGLDKQITSLEELLDSGIEYGFGESIDFYFEHSEVSLHKRLLKYRKICDHVQPCIKRIIDTRKFATIAELNVVNSILKTHHWHENICHMNNVDTFTILVAVYFSKGSYLVETFNKYMSSIFESGLINKEDTVTSIITTEDNIDRQDNVITYFVLTTDHLIIAFYALFLGHCLGFLIFIGEILNHKLDVVHRLNCMI
jgi:uncharacterized protein YqgQ